MWKVSTRPLGASDFFFYILLNEILFYVCVWIWTKAKELCTMPCHRLLLDINFRGKDILFCLHDCCFRLRLLLIGHQNTLMLKIVSTSMAKRWCVPTGTRHKYSVKIYIFILMDFFLLLSTKTISTSTTDASHGRTKVHSSEIGNFHVQPFGEGILRSVLKAIDIFYDRNTDWRSPIGKIITRRSIGGGARWKRNYNLLAVLSNAQLNIRPFQWNWPEIH
jgi:hypothetical protein